MKTSKEPCFIDTNIPMYAAGRDDPYKSACLHILQEIANGSLALEAYTSVEVFQEILYRYSSIGRLKEGLQIFDNFYTLMQGHIYEVTPKTIQRMRHLFEKYPQARARDLVHLAVMIEHQVPKIYTVDQHFDHFDEAQRLEPIVQRKKTKQKFLVFSL